MALIEQALAAQLIYLREQQHLGTQYTPIADHIAALHRHLHREQRLRAVICAMGDLIDAGTDK